MGLLARAAGVAGCAFVAVLGSAQAEAVDLRLCTGSPGKTYIKVGERLAAMAPQFTAGNLAIEVIPSGGSIDNMTRALAGECDAFIAQGDALAFFTREVDTSAAGRFEIVGELYKELALLLCSRESGIDDLDEVGTETVAAGNMGTGSLATLLTLQRIEPDTYGGITIFPANGFEGAMAVVQGKAVCVFDVIAPQSDLVSTLAENEQTSDVLQISEVDNSDLADFEIDGQTVYDFVTFDDELYESLSSFGDPETLAISALLVLESEYAKANPQARTSLSLLLLSGAGQITAEAYGDEKPFSE